MSLEDDMRRQMEEQAVQQQDDDVNAAFGFREIKKKNTNSLTKKGRKSYGFYRGAHEGQRVLGGSKKNHFTGKGGGKEAAT